MVDCRYADEPPIAAGNIRRIADALVTKLTIILLQMPGSPAELDGRLQKGDLLVSVDGKDVSKGDYVAAATALKLCGNKTSIKVKRFKIVR